MNYRRYAILFLVAGMVVGSIPPIIYHWLTLPGPPPSIPLSPWDSRACVKIPSSATCDGKYPWAPNDLSATTTTPIAGNGACVSEARKVAVTDIKAEGLLGRVELWWSPVCKSVYTHTTMAIDGFYDLLTYLAIFHAGVRSDRWHKDEAYTTTHLNYTRSQRQLWSVLIYTPMLPAQGCGGVTYKNQTYQACTDWYQAGKLVGWPGE